VAVLAATACAAPTASSAPTPAVPGVVPPGSFADPLADFPTMAVTVGDTALLVAVADTPDLRARGLMGVTELRGIDGMLFRWPADVESGFWMKDTPMPLDIGFFAADGSLLEVLAMEPCAADPCPVYRPEVGYRFALEVPSGGVVEWGRLALTP